MSVIGALGLSPEDSEKTIAEVASTAAVIVKKGGIRPK